MKTYGFKETLKTLAMDFYETTSSGRPQNCLKKLSTMLCVYGQRVMYSMHVGMPTYTIGYFLVLLTRLTITSRKQE